MLAHMAVSKTRRTAQPGTVGPLDEASRSTQASRPKASPRRPWWWVAIVAFVLAGAGIGFLIGRITADELTDGSSSDTTGFTELDQAAIDAVLQEGLTAHVAGDLATASVKYEQVLSVDPQNKFALFNLGLIAHTNIDYEAAVTNYEAALAVDPSYTPARFNLGLVFADQKRWTPAGEAFRLVLETEPDNAQATYQLGLVLIAEGDEAGGQELIDAAVALDPTVTSG
jgi:tetratricopeptide (TPR) repeat protein